MNKISLVRLLVNVRSSAYPSVNNSHRGCAVIAQKMTAKYPIYVCNYKLILYYNVHLILKAPFEIRNQRIKLCQRSSWSAETFPASEIRLLRCFFEKPYAGGYYILPLVCLYGQVPSLNLFFGRRCLFVLLQNVVPWTNYDAHFCFGGYIM